MAHIQTAEGTKIYYSDWGQGTPVVLIHGWPLNCDMWEKQALFLAENGLRVITYDRRGFGQSSQTWGGYDYDTLAADLNALMEELDLSGATLIGFSMGGGEVVRYLSRYGASRVAKAVLISSVTPFLLKTADNPDGVDPQVFADIEKEIRKDRFDFLKDFGYIPPAKYAALHAAALEACDTLDGVKDGVIEDPQKCRFDPQVLLCKGGDAASCLTAAQVDTARKTYAGTHAGKSTLWGLEPGSETGWASLSGPQPLGIALETYQYLVYKNPQWDYHTLDPAKDVPLADKALNPEMNASDPDLRPFFSHGGKLLMYHGWADPGIPPMFSVEYYKNVAAKVGGKKAADEIRLFMVPGMGHCGGGDGPSTFNAMAALSSWVEQGKAPQQIPASHASRGQTDRTRPLCPYPQAAVYKGSGSTNDASNFSCK